MLLPYIDNMRSLYELDKLPAGEIVSVRFAGVLRHYGVVTSRGSVISNSREGGGVVEQSLSAFKAGRALRRHGRKSVDHPIEIEARARRKLGRSYDLTGSNCIDFTRHTHRQRPTPWQVGRAGLMAVGDMLSKKNRYD